MTSPPFRVETVPVRRMGRGPIVIAALAVTLIAASIVKPWAGTDPGALDRAQELASPASVAVNVAIDAPADASSAPGRLVTAPGIAAADPAPLAPGQVECGSSDWRIVTLGDFGRWTVRTWIAITPVAASGPADPTIPDLSLGASDIAGLGACAPSASPISPGHASRIIEAWRRGAGGVTTTRAPAAPPGTPATLTAETVTAATYERVTLAQLDPLPSGGPVATRVTRESVTELFRPVPASQRGRWPAGRYVLLLASPDAGRDRWIAIDVGDTAK
jgi:hypothetical protein